MSNAQIQMAARFRAAHAPGKFLVLPNAWDVASARIAEDCGAEAIATSSAAVAWAHGYADGEKLPRKVLLQLVSDIARLAKVPITADSEAGYSADVTEVAGFVVSMAKAGAAGINIEDGTEPPPVLVAKIKAIKQACAREGVDIFINARTDVYLKSLVPAERRWTKRWRAENSIAIAGADGLFVPGLVDAAGYPESRRCDRSSHQCACMAQASRCCDVEKCRCASHQRRRWYGACGDGCNAARDARTVEGWKLRRTQYGSRRLSEFECVDDAITQDCHPRQRLARGKGTQVLGSREGEEISEIGFGNLNCSATWVPFPRAAAQRSPAMTGWVSA